MSIPCYNKATRRCQSKTLSSPDFESTYTNKASLEAFAVCKFRQVQNTFPLYFGGVSKVDQGLVAPSAFWYFLRPYLECLKNGSRAISFT